ncbi:MAG: TIGR03067 domain-containing protein [Gelidibacter sp.]
MKHTYLLLSLWCLLLACTMSCADASIASDQDKLQGVWLAQTESLNGLKKEVDFQYIFSKDTLTFIDETGQKEVYKYTLDTTSTPKYLNIQPEDATPVSVAYTLDGDDLTIVIAEPGFRPTDLSDTHQEVIVCKRKGS